MSALPPRFSRSSAPPLLLAAALALLTVGHVCAQVQETRMDDILHADRNQTSQFAGKTFVSSAAVGGRQAHVKPYVFTGSSLFGGADGTYRTGSFADRGKFRTGEFATKTDRANNANSFTQADRGFATKAMNVRNAPGVDKSAFGVRNYQPANKSIVVRGKRQGDLDDLYQQKNLSIDQVRDILNKPGHGTDAPLQRMGDAPVLRATAVPASEAR